MTTRDFCFQSTHLEMLSRLIYLFFRLKEELQPTALRCRRECFQEQLSCRSLWLSLRACTHARTRTHWSHPRVCSSTGPSASRGWLKLTLNGFHEPLQKTHINFSLIDNQSQTKFDTFCILSPQKIKIQCFCCVLPHVKSLDFPSCTTLIW